MLPAHRVLRATLNAQATGRGRICYQSAAASALNLRQAAREACYASMSCPVRNDAHSGATMPPSPPASDS